MKALIFQKNLKVVNEEKRMDLTLTREGLEACLLYTSDAADERSSVDLGGRRIIKKKKKQERARHRLHDKKKQKKT